MSKRKKIIIWLIIIVAIVAGAVFYFRSKKPVVVYTTAPVQKGNLVQTVSVTGKINPETQIDLAFKGSGILKSIDFDLGDKVKKGAKIASIDKGILLEQISQANADIKYQKETLDNMKKRDDIYNSDQRDAQRQIIKKYEAAKTALWKQFNEIYLVSPIDGKIIKKNFEAGENVIANSTVVTVAQGEMQIKANVPESDVVKVKTGQKAQITFDALTEEDKFQGEIIEIDPASTVIQDVVYYSVKLKINNLDDRIKPGMSANVDIRTAERDGVLMIPIRAIKTEGQNKFVDILKDNNQTEKVKIVTGLEGDEGMVEVKSGLAEGDKVVTFTKN